MNVRVNAKDLEDREIADRLVNEAKELMEAAEAREGQIVEHVFGKI